MLALVTGATGCLGREIIRQLHARGDRVRAFCRQPGDVADLKAATNGRADSARCEIALGDVRNAGATDAAVRGVDAVYHTAGLAGMWGPWKTYHAINTLGTKNVIDACRRHGVRRLIYTSSPSVVFTESDQCGADETIPYTRRWLCHYPRSKALAEQQVLAANGRDGLQTCALRPHLIWGPGDRQLLPRLFRRAKAGQLRRVGDGTNLIDIVHVENVAAAHLQAVEALSDGSQVCGRAYFISQTEPVNCWQWIDALLSLAGLPPVSRAISLARARQLGVAWETAYRLARIRQEPPMTRFLANQLGRSHWFDVSAARRDFGFRPHVSTDEGMHRLRDGFAISSEIDRCAI